MRNLIAAIFLLSAAPAAQGISEISYVGTGYISGDGIGGPLYADMDLWFFNPLYSLPQMQHFGLWIGRFGDRVDDGGTPYNIYDDVFSHTFYMSGIYMYGGHQFDRWDGSLHFQPFDRSFLAGGFLETGSGDGQWTSDTHTGFFVLDEANQ